MNLNFVTIFMYQSLRDFDKKSYNRPLRIFFFGAVVRLILRPPGYYPKKQRALYGGYMFCYVPPVWGRGTPGVVVGVAQNGTVGCEKVHLRRVTTNLGES